MPIRQSISAPDSRETKEFSRMLRDGPLPKTPKKPPASEREPLLTMLKAVPVGSNVTKETWIAKFINPMIRTQFSLWGIDFGVYVVSRTEYNDSKTITGVFLKAITRNKRGVQPMLKLNGKYEPYWYRLILDWLEEHYYGG